MFHPYPFARNLYLACCAALGCAIFSVIAHAQLPPLPPAKTASGPTAMERSQRQSDNVYRFIKQFADTPRKPEGGPARPKVDAVVAPTPVRRPDTPNTATPAATPTAQVDATPGAAASASTHTAPPAPAAAATSAPVLAATPEPPAPAPVEDDEEKLQLVEQVQPVFPRNAPDRGKVTVGFTVQPNGSVSEATVVTTSHRLFGKPAREAVAQWRFAPIKVARTVQIEIAFDLH